MKSDRAERVARSRLECSALRRLPPDSRTAKRARRIAHSLIRHREWQGAPRHPPPPQQTEREAQSSEKERGLTPPAFIKKPENLGTEIDDAIKFSQTHLAWSGQQDWIADFASELKDIHSQGMNAARKFVEKTRRIPCPAETGEGSCGNLLKIDADDPLNIFECRKCKSQWTTLRLVAVAMSDKRAVWLDAEAIGSYLGMTYKNVHEFARRHKVNRKGELFDFQQLVSLRKSDKI